MSWYDKLCQNSISNEPEVPDHNVYMEGPAIHRFDPNSLFGSSTFSSQKNVFSSDFFEHINLEVKEKVISEIYRVLKPGGKLTIKTPNLNFLKVVIFIKRILNVLRLRSPFIYIPHTRNNPDNEHHGLTTHSELSTLLEDNYFHTPDIVYVPLIRKGLPKYITKILFGKKDLLRSNNSVVKKGCLLWFMGIKID